MKRNQARWSIFLLLLSFVINGCYTQLAKTTYESDEQVYDEEIERGDEEKYTEENGDKHVTNVYIYDDYYGGRYWDPWYSSYHSPRSPYYISVGYGYHSNPWYGDHYYGRRIAYYDPYYNHGYQNGHHGHHSNHTTTVKEPQKKRDFRRVGRTGSQHVGTNGNSTVAKRVRSRRHLNKSTDAVYAVGNDGQYRRTRGNRTARTTNRGRSVVTDRHHFSDSAGDENPPASTGSNVAKPAPKQEQSYRSKSSARNHSRKKSSRGRVSSQRSSSSTEKSSTVKRSTSKSTRKTTRSSPSNSSSSGSNSKSSNSGSVQKSNTSTKSSSSSRSNGSKRSGRRRSRN